MNWQSVFDGCKHAILQFEMKFPKEIRITNSKSLRMARKLSKNINLVTAIRMNQPCWVNWSLFRFELPLI